MQLLLSVQPAGLAKVRADCNGLAMQDSDGTITLLTFLKSVADLAHGGQLAGAMSDMLPGHAEHKLPQSLLLPQTWSSIFWGSITSRSAMLEHGCS